MPICASWCSVVPIEAVIRDGEQASVWVAREPMLFYRRKVKIGLERDGRVQVLEGVTAGESVWKVHVHGCLLTLPTRVSRRARF